MKILKILLNSSTILILSILIVGCGVSPQKFQTQLWDDLSKPDIPISGHVELPKLDPIIENETIIFDKNASSDLINYMDASKANIKIIEQYVMILNELENERSALITAGKLTEQRSNYLADKYADSENGRRYEEQMRLIERASFVLLFAFFGL